MATLNNLNYDGLIELVKTICNINSQKFLDQIPFFISQAELFVNKVCKIIPMKINLIGPVVLLENSQLVGKPPEWYRTVFMTGVYTINNIEKNVTLKKRNLAFCQYLNAQLKEKPREVLYFADDYDEFNYYFAPISSVPVLLYITYYAQFAPLGENTGTNTLTRTVPDLLLSATLIQAYQFLQDSTLLTQESQKFDILLKTYTATDVKATESQYSTFPTLNTPAPTVGS